MEAGPLPGGAGGGRSSHARLLSDATAGGPHGPSCSTGAGWMERGEGREEERNINVWLSLTRPLLGTWPQPSQRRRRETEREKHPPAASLTRPEWRWIEPAAFWCTDDGRRSNPRGHTAGPERNTFQAWSPVPRHTR
ncbi:hypothetical protein HJG60_008423 [Phyllostomus discolor]|uniref:Uncharacterized protein n=1 Tax=Phyllostomus discolor TaxID=89673 RepID=A0A833Z4K9_9CHIR|nr:hypothetical protein HJG60_008423 [Phyllostomus discolor]